MSTCESLYPIRNIKHTWFLTLFYYTNALEQFLFFCRDNEVYLFDSLFCLLNVRNQMMRILKSWIARKILACLKVSLLRKNHNWHSFVNILYWFILSYLAYTRWFSHNFQPSLWFWYIMVVVSMIYAVLMRLS